MEKGRSWVLGSYCTKRETTEICKYCLALERGDGGVKDLSNRGKPLRIFKVITSGSEAVAYICNYHVHLSIDEGVGIVTLDVFVNGVIQLFFS